MAEAAEAWLWCAPAADGSSWRRRGCGEFISQDKLCAAVPRFPWDAWQPGAAPPALAALQPKMKFHFPPSSSRRFWFHCNNGADHVPVSLWDKLAVSASPNFYGPGPKVPCDSRAGMFLLGWHCQSPCPPRAGSAFCRAHFSPNLLGLEMFPFLAQTQHELLPFPSESQVWKQP